MAIYESEYTVGLTDLNRNNKITNKAIIKILENVGSMHSEKIGYGVNDIPRTGISWIILGWKVKVLKRVTFNQKLLIKTWGRSYNRAFMFRDYEIYDEQNNKIAIATSKWSIIDAKKGSLLEVKEDLAEKYEIEDKKVFEEDYKFKLKEEKNNLSCKEITIPRRDIDLNMHVHNLYYLDYAYEALPNDVYEKEEFDNIEIMYKRQIKYNDKINCFYSNEDGNIITIKSEDEKILHAIVKLY